VDEASNGQAGGPRLRLGEHADWLPLDLVQRVVDIMWERDRARLSGLLGEAMTGARPAASRAAKGAGQ
jgi:hypothetical protein